MASRPLPGGSRVRQIGWMAALAVCTTLFLALTFHVNAVKSDVRLTERKIIAVAHEARMLETEFQTRASQHQLALWNAVEFGYAAPRADQFVEYERQLALLGAPPVRGAPEPIRVAAARPKSERGLFAEGVLALTAGGSDDIQAIAASSLELPAADLAARLASPRRGDYAMAGASQ